MQTLHLARLAAAGRAPGPAPRDRRRSTRALAPLSTTGFALPDRSQSQPGGEHSARLREPSEPSCSPRVHCARIPTDRLPTLCPRGEQIPKGRQLALRPSSGTRPPGPLAARGAPAPQSDYLTTAPPSRPPARSECARQDALLSAPDAQGSRHHSFSIIAFSSSCRAAEASE